GLGTEILAVGLGRAEETEFHVRTNSAYLLAHILVGEPVSTSPGYALEPRNVRERDVAAAHVHAPELRPPVQRPKHLAGMAQALPVEGALGPLLLVEVGFREHRRHQVALLDADAVLAGEHAADLDAQPQDVGAERLGAVELARLVGIVEDERMQVAVAGV